MKLSNEVQDCILGGACMVTLIGVSYFTGDWFDPMCVIGGIIGTGLVVITVNKLTTVKGESHEETQQE